MGIGLEVTNENGRKQVVDSAPLLTYMSKTTGINDNNKEWVDPRATIGLSPAEGKSLITRFVLTDRLITYEDGSKARQELSKGEGSFYFFEYGVAPTATSFGLELFNEQGELQFSSNQKPLRLLDVIDVDDIRNHRTSTNGFNGYCAKTFPNKDIAVIMINYPVWQNHDKLMTAAPTKRGYTITFEDFIEDQNSDLIGAGVYSAWNLKALIVDVTNY